MSSQSPLILHGDKISQPCQSIELLLLENNVPYEYNTVDLHSGENLTEQFKKLNPKGQIPCIDDNGFHLAESEAILRYICCKYQLTTSGTDSASSPKIESHWYPINSSKLVDIQTCAKIDSILGWYHTGIRKYTVPLVLSLFTCSMLPSVLLKNNVKKDIVGHHNALVNALSSLENLLQEQQTNGHKFLVGDKLTIADLVVLCEMTELKYVGWNFGCGSLKRVEKFVEDAENALNKDHVDNVLGGFKSNGSVFQKANHEYLGDFLKKP